MMIIIMTVFAMSVVNAGAEYHQTVHNCQCSLAL